MTDSQRERLDTALAGQYRTERELGAGGMATVYLARDERHKRSVALKVLKPDLTAAVGSDRFLREIETTAKLRHPHILPLYDSGTADGILYYVMPFVEGESLRQLMDRKGRLPLDSALRIVAEVSDALSHAHERGIVHRDVKPGNILLENGHAVVTDFGIAHAVSESGGEGLTQTGAIVGTPHYMSPEQVDGDDVDARSDLYAMGCVLYEMLAGTPPYTGPSALVVLARHALEPVPALKNARPDVPASVAEVIERALAKAPADRHASTAAWCDALTAAQGRAEVEGEGSAATRSDGDLPVELPDRPTIAILPFKNLGSDPDQAFLADGIRLGIQASLVQLSGIFLVNVPALNAYRDSEQSAESVGHELEVRYVLDGALQQAGQRIRVTVRLTDTEAGRIVLAERYDRLLDDVFELQDEITHEVIRAVSDKLQYKGLGRLWFKGLKTREASEYFFRGASHLYAGTREDNLIAREMFEKLYEAHPESVTGPSYLAFTYWHEAFQGWSESPEESLEQARRWAEKAMEYEDNNGIGHAVYGHLLVLDRQHDEALATCDQAVKLRESCPLAHGLLGVVLNYCGDSEGAVRELREALSLERVYPPWLLTFLAAAYRDGGEIDTSVTAARQSLRLAPQEQETLLVLCSDYQLADRPDEAKRLAAEVRARHPDFRVSDYATRHPYRDEASLARVLDTLRTAGLPD